MRGDVTEKPSKFAPTVEHNQIGKIPSFALRDLGSTFGQVEVEAEASALHHLIGTESFFLFLLLSYCSYLI